MPCYGSFLWPKVLQRMLKSPQQRVVRFSAGALKNARDHFEDDDVLDGGARPSALQRSLSPFQA
jgi:hypothetical protein